MTFPGGWPGVGLLLLRAAAGVTTLLQGGLYFVDRRDLIAWPAVVGMIAILGGTLVIIGLLTPVASAMIAIGTISASVSSFPVPSGNLLNAPLQIVLIAIIAAAVVLLGPGALSLDARLFGRREIIIPYRPAPKP